MTDAEKKAFVAQHESRNGVRGDSHVYMDTQGNPTVGVGFNLDRPGAAAVLASVGADYNAVRNVPANLTSFQITTLFEADYNAAVKNLQQLLGNDYAIMAPNRRADMTDMGAATFATFTKMIAAIRAGDWETVASEMAKSKWALQVKTRAIHDIQTIKTSQACDPIPTALPKDAAGNYHHDPDTSATDPNAGGGGGIQVIYHFEVCTVAYYSAYYEGRWVTVSDITCTTV